MLLHYLSLCHTLKLLSRVKLIFLLITIELADPAAHGAPLHMICIYIRFKKENNDTCDLHED